jgi:tetratricopeptide (TPR) repeat protein
MQDPNNENTIPYQPKRDDGETVPTHVSNNSEPVPPQVEATQPVPAARYTSAAHDLASRTTPVTALPEGIAPKVKKARGPRRWPFVALGIVMILLFAGFGGLGGYNSALKMRQAQQEEQRVARAKEHFMFGLVAQSNKQYEVARQQYEYVIRQDPNFPGVQDKLREVLIEMSTVNTPTPLPTVATPTLTPTRDLRPLEDIYNQSRLQYAAQDWEGLFATIDSLRRVDPKYRAVEIDGMLYMALRHRGIDKILHQANLEGGLYDLALAERFGPLDVDSIGYRNWARQYLNGASFWEADWEKVMAYFEEIYPYFPNMRDSSGMTAIERYRIAARSQGDKLMAADDPCGAYEFYKKSLNAVPDAELEKIAEEAYLECYPPTATATATPEVTVTPQVTIPAEATPTDEPPAEATPTPEGAATPTAEPAGN